MTDLTRKVRQLDADVGAIYSMLSNIEATQRRQGNRLDEVDEKLVGVDEKLDRVLDLLEKRQ